MPLLKHRSADPFARSPPSAIANGCFFNIGARLARYTGNKTYAEHAEKTFDWLWAVNYIDHENYKVYDGGHVNNNCTDIHKAQFSYNIAVLLQGAAFMYNYVRFSNPGCLPPTFMLRVATHRGNRTHFADDAPGIQTDQRSRHLAR